jgi:alkylated DNA repair protein (DNA oxidative demethylase)
MSRIQGAELKDLLSGTDAPHGNAETLGAGAMLLRGFALSEVKALVKGVELVAAKAPFRHMITPGGYRMSVGMTNCGRAGWITDRRGYRYDALDPETQRPWPAMPPAFQRLAMRAAEAAGFAGFAPDACLINRYEPGARLTLHQDKNERDFAQPIVSVSLGLPAVFLFGGARRADRPRRVMLESGDVVVWGGVARMAFHGIEKLAEGDDSLTGNCRINLTLRKAL